MTLHAICSANCMSDIVAGVSSGFSPRSRMCQRWALSVPCHSVRICSSIRLISTGSISLSPSEGTSTWPTGMPLSKYRRLCRCASNTVSVSMRIAEIGVMPQSGVAGSTMWRNRIRSSPETVVVLPSSLRRLAWDTSHHAFALG